MRTRPPRSRWLRLAALPTAIAIVLAACSGSSTPTATPAPATPPPTQAAAATPSPTPAPTPEKTLQIAYISFAVANSYDAPMLAAAQAAAAAGNAQLTVMDSNNDPATQSKLLQDAVASGKYDGILVQPIYGGGLVTGVQDAISKGIAVGNIDQVLGTDYTTADAQVDGLSANVIFVPSNMGKKIADLAIQACADSGASPCKIGYIFSIKAAGLDQELRSAFDAEVAASGANIQVVAEGESYYTSALGLKAAQDMLTAHPDLNVIMGADQAITGALQAVDAAGVKGKVLLVGYGGGAVALQGVASGDRYGTVMQAPATEGRVGTTNLIQAIRSGTATAGVDVLADLPDGGVVNQSNVSTFLPLAEWPG